MAKPNGRGGWDLSDDDVAEVLAASAGPRETVSTGPHELACLATKMVREDGTHFYAGVCTCEIIRDEREGCAQTVERVLAAWGWNDRWVVRIAAAIRSRGMTDG